MNNIKRYIIIMLIIFLFTAFFPSAHGVEKKSKLPADTTMTLDLKGFNQKELSVTHHEMTVNGKTLRFTATAGYIPMQDQKNEIKAKIFFVSYTKDDEDISKRPISFAFNGGPGSASLWLHFGALGPKRVVLSQEGGLPQPPYKFEDNDYTWLDFTDVVMIDPVDTGYSRAAEKENLKEFMGVHEDVVSVSNFIRIYITLFKRWQSPKYIVGESYGGIRGSGLADHLQSELGIHLNGIVFVSPAINYGTLFIDFNGDLPYVLMLPTYTAVALYHKKIPYSGNKDNLLKEVEKWALTEYLVALAKGNTISSHEKDQVAEKLAQYTGLSKKYILNSNLRIRDYRFMKELLKDQSQVMGYYDGRLTSLEPDSGDSFPENDPTSFLSGPYMTAVHEYFRNGLKYINHLPYNTFSDNAGAKWNWESGSSAGFGYIDYSDKLAWSISNNPYMKVYVACGYYDICTPYMAALYTFSHLRIPNELKKNITFGFYEGGHMMYNNPPTRKKLYEDIKKFYTDSNNTKEDKKKDKDKK